jgi:5'-deoxynucleotidase YfbR-like HD superfamily hydrolase
MKLKPLPLPPDQILVNTRTLAKRWGVDARTVLRIARFHDLAEYCLVDDGRVMLAREDVDALESEIFKWN